MLLNMSYRRPRRVSLSRLLTSASTRTSTSSTNRAAAAGSVCAPPIGSGMISSMIAAFSRSGAVSLSAAAASTFFA